MDDKYSFSCDCCGKTYTEMPLCFGSEYPDYYFTVPIDERDKRIELAESLCVIDDHFFHRGRVTIPILDYHENLEFNVWTTISKENFELRNSIWNDLHRIKQDPYFGWLQTNVPTYENTINIKTVAHENNVGLIPNIEVIEEKHQLHYDQQNGITLEEATNKVKKILANLHKTT